MSVRLYVGNLPAELDRQALEKIFHESGESVTLKVITDRKTGRCRGFGFVTVESTEQADTVIEKFNGFEFNGAVLRLEKALPRQKDKPDREDHEEAGMEAEETEENPSEESSQANEEGDAQRMPAKRKKRRSKKQSKKPELRSTSSSEIHQPDPRWANELEELRQRLLAAQSAN